VSKKHHEHTETPKETETPSIIQPIIDDLKGQTKTYYPSDDELGAPNPAGPGHPPQPADLDQDPGGDDNPEGTIPQP
jgi:hypothetical protein